MTKKTKLLFALVFAVGLCVGGSIAAFSTLNASAGISEDQAKTLASREVPAGVTLVSTEDDFNKYEFTYRDDKAGVTYEVEVNKNKQQVMSVSMELDNDRGGSSQVLTEQDVNKLVADKFHNAQVTSFKLDKDDGTFLYEVSFKTNGLYGEAEINAETGEILTSDIHYGKASTIPLSNKTVNKTKTTGNSNTDSASAANGKATISQTDAAKVVDGKIPGATISYMELDYDDGICEYEGEAYCNGKKYEFCINAATGFITDWEIDDDDDYYNPGITPKTTQPGPKTTQPKTPANNQYKGGWDDDDWDDDDQYDHDDD